MGMVELELEDFAAAYDRWAALLCPCCGVAEFNDATDGPPAVIGEGVMICGRCVANEHGRESDQFFPMMLTAILTGAIAARSRS
jgi:acetyltransferase-like isoleucine patch superfamily enzyme